MALGFTFAQLQYFCSVAELGSFAAAADAQHVSPNAVASSVNALEEHLGCVLCVRRRSRGVELTTAGEALFQRAKEIVTLAEELHSAMAPRESDESDVLALGCAPPLASTILTRLTDAFARRHPRTGLGLTIDDQVALISELRSGELDAAILYDDGGIPGELERRELYTRAVHVILGKRHRLAHRKSLNLRELADDPLVLLDASPMRESILGTLRDFGVTPDIRYRVSDHEIAKRLVARGHGYTMAVLDTIVDKSDLGKGLVYVPVAPKPPEQGIVIAWSAVEPNPRLTELISLATQQAARPKGRGL